MSEDQDLGFREKDVTWKKDRIYVRGVRTGVTIVKHQIHSNMYWINWEWKEKDHSENSHDFYNLTRAKDNARQFTLKELNNDTFDCY